METNRIVSLMQQYASTMITLTVMELMKEISIQLLPTNWAMF